MNIEEKYQAAERWINRCTDNDSLFVNTCDAIRAAMLAMLAVLDDCQVIFYGEEYEGEESRTYELHAPLRRRIEELGK